jgi:uncharacterized protein YjbJ (UPF0337 family)
MMGVTNGIKNKVKGKAKQLQGVLEQETGQQFKGGMSKAQGKVTEVIGDLEINANKRVRGNR